MNLEEMVKINRKIIGLIYKKAEKEGLHTLPMYEHDYVERLIADNKQAEKWLAIGLTK